MVAGTRARRIRIMSMNDESNGYGPRAPHTPPLVGDMPLLLPRRRRFAITREVWDADGEWHYEHETITADRVQNFSGSLLFTDSDSGDTLIVPSETLVGAWTEGVRSH